MRWHPFLFLRDAALAGAWSPSALLSVMLASTLVTVNQGSLAHGVSVQAVKGVTSCPPPPRNPSGRPILDWNPPPSNGANNPGDSVPEVPPLPPGPPPLGWPVCPMQHPKTLYPPAIPQEGFDPRGLEGTEVPGGPEPLPTIGTMVVAGRVCDGLGAWAPAPPTRRLYPQPAPACSIRIRARTRMCCRRLQQVLASALSTLRAGSVLTQDETLGRLCTPDRSPHTNSCATV